MKFIVSDGRVKDCVLKEVSGRKFWVTPNKGWLVAHEDGTPIEGCSAYVEPEAEVVPDKSWTVASIKEWLDSQEISYTSSMLKADLLALVQ
jgi:hypothetical protein